MLANESQTIMEDSVNSCGLSKCHPKWLQRFANAKTFMLVYGLLGTVQATSYMYFIVTLTTVEKRFKMPSQTTGIVLSGNEISQILLSLVLSYVGGQRNRPRWIAWGIVFCGLSCYILVMPHLIYGPGEEALQITEEYYHVLTESNDALNATIAVVNSSRDTSQHLCESGQIPVVTAEPMISYIPLILIFLSQFVLGIGNTLYYSLGQTYLDDNTKKTNSPLILALTMSLRMIGPALGFVLGYLSLNIFVDPWKTPLVDSKDPRWLGAWWFGWVILGTIMVVFSGLIGLFPKELPKEIQQDCRSSHLPRMLQMEMDDATSTPLRSAYASCTTLNKTVSTRNSNNSHQLRDLPRNLLCLLTNKLLICNIMSAIFYILGSAGYMTFLTKYMEVQFYRNAQSSTIIVGPMSIVGMLTGLIASGIIITKTKPPPRILLMWNVIVGIVYILGQILYTFLYCQEINPIIINEMTNLTTECNEQCYCDNVPYTPICHDATGTTYFSPCHAGCQTWNAQEKYYSDCLCLPDVPTNLSLPESSEIALDLKPNHTANDAGDDFNSFRIMKMGACIWDCNISYWLFILTSLLVNWFGSSGRVSNVLVNYRAVHKRDKAFAQGLSLMLISLFALIPGPIIFGAIIDSTCLLWMQNFDGDDNSVSRGNCQLYDQTKFRYLVNAMAITLTAIGMLFDLMVWYYGRNLNLYAEEKQRLDDTFDNSNELKILINRK